MSSLEDQLQEVLKESASAQTSAFGLAMAKALHRLGVSVEIDTKEHAVTVGIPSATKQQFNQQSAQQQVAQSNTGLGFVDMKPLFKNSSKVQYNKAHEWYVIVPIRRKTRTMSTSLYAAARGIAMNATQNLDDLLTERPVMDSPFGQLPANVQKDGTQKLSGNLTRVHMDSTAINRNRGSAYIAFRTVSQKSKPNSWIFHYNQQDTDETQAKLDNLEAIIHAMTGA